MKAESMSWMKGGLSESGAAQAGSHIPSEMQISLKADKKRVSGSAQSSYCFDPRGWLPFEILCLSPLLAYLVGATGPTAPALVPAL